MFGLMLNLSCIGTGRSRAPGTFGAAWTRVNVPPETVITLSKIKIKDIPDNAVVTPSAGVTVSINGGAYGGATTMSAGDTIAARITSGDYEAVVTGSVSIDGVSCAISVTTMVEGFTSWIEPGVWDDTLIWTE